MGGDGNAANASKFGRSKEIEGVEGWRCRLVRGGG